MLPVVSLSSRFNLRLLLLSSNVLTIGLATGEGVANSLSGGADGHTNFGVDCG